MSVPLHVGTVDCTAHLVLGGRVLAFALAYAGERPLTLPPLSRRFVPRLAGAGAVFGGWLNIYRFGTTPLPHLMPARSPFCARTISTLLDPVSSPSSLYITTGHGRCATATPRARIRRIDLHGLPHVLVACVWPLDLSASSYATPCLRTTHRRLRRLRCLLRRRYLANLRPTPQRRTFGMAQRLIPLLHNDVNAWLRTFVLHLTLRRCTPRTSSLLVVSLRRCIQPN